MQSITDYQNSKFMIENRTSYAISLYLIFIWLIILGFLLFSVSYKYHSYLSYYGTVITEDNSYYLSILINQQDINRLSKYLIIKQNKYNYKIESISKELYYDNQELSYQVNLKVKLGKDSVINNNIIAVNFELEAKTLYERIKEKLKKGMMQWIN